MNRDKYLKYKRKYLELKESLLKGGSSSSSNYAFNQMSLASQRVETEGSIKNAEKRSDLAALKESMSQQHTNSPGPQLIKHGPDVTAIIIKNSEELAKHNKKILRDAQAAKEKKAKQKAWDDASIFGKTYIVVDSFVRTISPFRR